MCTGIEIALIAGTALAAGTASYSAVDQHNQAKASRDSQKNLEETRAKQLADEAATREAARIKAEGSGRRAGGSLSASAFSAPLGFGSGNTSAGLGMGRLFGN